MVSQGIRSSQPIFNLARHLVYSAHEIIEVGAVNVERFLYLELEST